MSKIKGWCYNKNTLSNVVRRFYLVVTILFCVSLLPAKSQENSNTMLKLIKSYYNLRSRVLHVEKVNEARWVLSNNERYVGHFNLSGRTESSNLVLSNDTLFVSIRDTIICLKGKIGTKYWAKKYRHNPNKEMLNTKHNLTIADYKSLTGINKKTGERSWTNSQFPIRPNNGNLINGYIVGVDNTIIKLIDPSSGNVTKSFSVGTKVDDIETFNDFIIFGSKTDSIYKLDILSGKIKWKLPILSYSSFEIKQNKILIKWNKEIQVIDINTGNIESTQDINESYPEFRVYRKSILCIYGQDSIGLECLKSRKIKWIYHFPKNETIRFNARFDQLNIDKNILYLNSEQGKLRAINLKNGKILWEFDTYSRVTSNIVFGDGVLYLVNVTGQVIAVDTNLKDGVQKWRNLRDFE